MKINVKEHIPLIYYAIRRWFRGYDYENGLFSAGQIGLLKASKSYDETKNITFATFAIKAIKRAMMRELFKGAITREEYVFPGIVKMKHTDIDKYVLHDVYYDEQKRLKEEHRDMIKVISNSNLSAKIKKIITYHYIYGYTLNELAELFKNSRQYISYVLKDRVKELRYSYGTIR